MRPATSGPRRSTVAVLVAAVLVALVRATPASAQDGFLEGNAKPPVVSPAPVQGQARSCRMYGSASGFGLACAVPSGGLSELVLGLGATLETRINTSEAQLLQITLNR